jgi:hypothetical protein
MQGETVFAGAYREREVCAYSTTVPNIRTFAHQMNN